MTSGNKAKLNNYVELVENKLNTYCGLSGNNSGMELTKSLYSAMNYSLSAGGKRIRPVLVLEFCRMCGGDYSSALSAACAIEMIHTFSLIHDDLPAMDNDDFRRGKPSCHKAYGEAVAILAGDALAVLPYEIIAKDTALPDKCKVALIAELSNATGGEGMIGGQIIDIENENNKISKNDLLLLYSLKTGALLKTACKMGCIAASADKEKVQAAASYAEKLGLAFQIIDDILDVTGSSDVLGKPVGSDAEQNKQTYVSVFGLEEAERDAEKLTLEAVAILENKFDDNSFLIDLTKELLIRNN